MPLWQEVAGRADITRIAEKDGLDSLKALVAPPRTRRKAWPRRTGRRLLSASDGSRPPCLAASLLADEGIPLGFAKAMSHWRDWATHAHASNGRANTQHRLARSDGRRFCRIHALRFRVVPTAPKIQANVQLAPVRLMNQGVCALFPAKPGARYAVEYRRLRFGVPSDVAWRVKRFRRRWFFQAIRYEFDLVVRHDRLIDWIHEEGIGHHWMAGYGHVGRDYSPVGEDCWSQNPYSLESVVF